MLISDRSKDATRLSLAKSVFHPPFTGLGDRYCGGTFQRFQLFFRYRSGFKVTCNRGLSIPFWRPLPGLRLLPRGVGITNHLVFGGGESLYSIYELF